MKKLMVAFAAVAMAISANAITYAWGTGPAVNYGTTWDAESYNGSTYYLIQGDDSAAAAAINAILAASDFQSEFANQVAGAFNSAVYDAENYVMNDAAKGSFDGDLGAVIFDGTDTSSLPFYQLILDSKGVYVSEIIDSDYQTVGSTGIFFGNDSDTTFGSDVKTYQGSGWYTAAAVPEPTSGLLLLLGVAGLALRRRRA